MSPFPFILFFHQGLCSSSSSFWEWVNSAPLPCLSMPLGYALLHPWLEVLISLSSCLSHLLPGLASSVPPPPPPWAPNLDPCLCGSCDLCLITLRPLLAQSLACPCSQLCPPCPSSPPFPPASLVLLPPAVLRFSCVSESPGKLSAVVSLTSSIGI